jgi:hypothetical protein
MLTNKMTTLPEAVDEAVEVIAVTPTPAPHEWLTFLGLAVEKPLGETPPARPDIPR